MFKYVAFWLLGLSLGGCAREAPIYLVAPANAPAPSARPVSLTTGFRAWATVEPGDWAELNRKVTPQGGGT